MLQARKGRVNMKRYIWILMMIISPCWAFEEALESVKTAQLIETLCRNPQSVGWIEQGRIDAAHRAFDAVTGETTESKETIVTDGIRFTWQIQVESYGKKDSQDLQQVKEFMQSNQSRLFVWDGQSYTIYFKSSKQAMVYDNSASLPVRLSGALTAGYIPWGRGAFSPKALSEAKVSTSQITSGKESQVLLTIQASERPELKLVLDPSKNYAADSYTIEKGNSQTVHTYGNYVLKSGRYIPTIILKEKYINGKLQSSDHWEILKMDEYLPSQDSFTAPLEDETLVEYHTSLLDKPLFYHHSVGKNIRPLLDKRMQTSLKSEVQKQNCGSLAVEQILEHFSLAATEKELSALIEEKSEVTSLYQIQNLIQDKGLYALPVKIPLEMLARLKDYQVVIHLPAKKHFVVLDRVDNDKVWIIDMSRQTFYHSMDLSELKQEWAGIVLLVSAKPIDLQKGFVPIPLDVLEQIKGAGSYSCSELLQEYHVNLCPQMTLSTCVGRYEVWYELFRCKQDPQGGGCLGSPLPGRVYSYCVEDYEIPGECTITGNWICRYMRACQP